MKYAYNVCLEVYLNGTTRDVNTIITTDYNRDDNKNFQCLIDSIKDNINLGTKAYNFAIKSAKFLHEINE